MSPYDFALLVDEDRFDLAVRVDRFPTSPTLYDPGDPAEWTVVSATLTVGGTVAPLPAELVNALAEEHEDEIADAVIDWIDRQDPRGR